MTYFESMANKFEEFIRYFYSCAQIMIFIIIEKYWCSTCKTKRFLYHANVVNSIIQILVMSAALKYELRIKYLSIRYKYLALKFSF